MEWIRVEDRLPDGNKHYLVIWENYASKDHPNICSKYNVLFYLSKWWAPVSDKQPVTHWMPLPEPPKTEE